MVEVVVAVEFGAAGADPATDWPGEAGGPSPPSVVAAGADLPGSGLATALVVAEGITPAAAVPLPLPPPPPSSLV